jgi:zinc D-Ala-D-Ala carboxypeptidase
VTRGGAVALFGLVGVGALALLVAGGGSGGPVVRTVDAMKIRLGQFFTVAEFARSTAATRLGVDNTPPSAVQANLVRLVARVLDPLRVAVGREVDVTSGYRSPAVNREVRGSATSQHMIGEAADIKVDGMTALELATLIVRLGLPFDESSGTPPSAVATSTSATPSAARTAAARSSPPRPAATSPGFRTSARRPEPTSRSTRVWETIPVDPRDRAGDGGVWPDVSGRLEAACGRPS